MKNLISIHIKQQNVLIEKVKISKNRLNKLILLNRRFSDIYIFNNRIYFDEKNKVSICFNRMEEEDLLKRENWWGDYYYTFLKVEELSTSFISYYSKQFCNYKKNLLDILTKLKKEIVEFKKDLSVIDLISENQINILTRKQIETILGNSIWF